MSRLTLQEYLNERIRDVNIYIELNERKNDKDFFAHKELELYQMAQKYMQLTNELGCPLDVVFKLKDAESIFVKGYGNEFDTWETDDFYLVWERTPYIEIFKNGEPLRSYYLKDYKKTWWLSSDLEEQDEQH